MVRLGGLGESGRAEDQGEPGDQGQSSRAEDLVESGRVGDLGESGVLASWANGPQQRSYAVRNGEKDLDPGENRVHSGTPPAKRSREPRHAKGRAIAESLTELKAPQ